MPRIAWTAERDQQLMAALIAAHPELRPNYNKIATIFGEGATFCSIEKRFRKINQAAKELLESGGMATLSENTDELVSKTPKSTPRKRKAAETLSKNAKAKKGNEKLKKTAMVEGDEVEDEEYYSTFSEITPGEGRGTIADEAVDSEPETFDT